mmetsp:Transcript_532/g.1887  ORF Transcript_532/g.1887 Transcript_532/m.1887 type:complete len:371 (-) Transcript_532:748-1860(-)
MELNVRWRWSRCTGPTGRLLFEEEVLDDDVVEVRVVAEAVQGIRRPVQERVVVRSVEGRRREDRRLPLLFVPVGGGGEEAEEVVVEAVVGVAVVVLETVVLVGHVVVVLVGHGAQAEGGEERGEKRAVVVVDGLEGVDRAVEVADGRQFAAGSIAELWCEGSVRRIVGDAVVGTLEELGRISPEDDRGDGVPLRLAREAVQSDPRGGVRGIGDDRPVAEGPRAVLGGGPREADDEALEKKVGESYGEVVPIRLEALVPELPQAPPRLGLAQGLPVDQPPPQEQERLLFFVFLFLLFSLRKIIISRPQGSDEKVEVEEGRSLVGEAGAPRGLAVGALAVVVRGSGSGVEGAGGEAGVVRCHGNVDRQARRS